MCSDRGHYLGVRQPNVLRFARRGGQEKYKGLLEEKLSEFPSLGRPEQIVMKQVKQFSSAWQQNNTPRMTCQGRHDAPVQSS